MRSGAVRAGGALTAALALSSYAAPLPVPVPDRFAPRSTPRTPSPTGMARPPFGSTAPEADTAGSAQAARLINTARVLDALPGAGRPFGFAGLADDFDRAQTCLAAAAWYEAGDDPAGERAVIQVVLNRVRHPIYPATVCGVVFQGAHLRTGCQFTFTCDGALARRPGQAAWQRARALAAAALHGAVDPTVGEATHYHADYVYPYWAPGLVKLARVGAHIFYRFPWRARGRSAAELSRTEPAVTQVAFLGSGAEHDADADAALALGTPQPDGAPPVALFAPAVAVPAARMAAPPGAMVLALDPVSPPGRWAMEALSRCAGKADCQVLGWTSAAATLRERPAFVFIRNAAARAEIALWDCARTVRADPRQCMPRDAAALGRLLAVQGPGQGHGKEGISP
ncbi:hypothetical protein A8V01_18655 [Novosphingobium guangzhouense]|uniref:Cell wall hydrolase SleB domain-containing protein n=1 Tax=Novosphingobium guangzhouense TaxID=1850347 RepID=A0A2K2G178_9SPHN|nr:hypothetical protein A8V01_18655 [Novosphingobium guangzhouense]